MSTAAAVAALTIVPSIAVAAGTVVTTRKAPNSDPIVVAANGHTLYLFTKDSKGRSACTGTCAQKFKPLLSTGAPSARAGSGLLQSKLTSLKLPNGGSQVVYYGHPLYTDTGDTKAGQSNGESSFQFGGYWYAVDATGHEAALAPIY